jgi:hypothetical protein
VGVTETSVPASTPAAPPAPWVVTALSVDEHATGGAKAQQIVTMKRKHVGVRRMDPILARANRSAAGFRQNQEEQERTRTPATDDMVT